MIKINTSNFIEYYDIIFQFLIQLRNVVESAFDTILYNSIKCLYNIKEDNVQHTIGDQTLQTKPVIFITKTHTTFE